MKTNVIKEIIIGFGEPLYSITIGTRRFKIGWQFDFLIDSIKHGPISQADIMRSSRRTPRTVMRYIKKLEQKHIIRSSYACNGRGKVKILMLNPRAEFREVSVDPRLSKIFFER